MIDKMYWTYYFIIRDISLLHLDYISVQ